MSNNGACPAARTAIRDVSKSEDFGGDAAITWEFTIASLRAGNHSLAVGVNDVNDLSGNSGDKNAQVNFAFAVEAPAEGEGEGEPVDEGCLSAGPSSSVAPLALAALLFVARRRRR